MPDRSQITKILVLLFFLFILIFNIVTIRDGHNWGDDFSQYLISANNILTGQPISSRIMLDNAVVYPPGFSLLLAPVVKVFGLNFKILKLLNVFFWFSAIAVLYGVFARVGGGRFAFFSSMLLAVSSVFFEFKQNVLSDIPFFFFVCFALYAFEHYRERQNQLWFFAFVLSMSAALWIRSAGIILFLSALFYFLLIVRNGRDASRVAAALLANGAILMILMGIHPGFFSLIERTPGVFLLSVIYNFSKSFMAVWYFLCPPQAVVTSFAFNCVNGLANSIAPVIYLLCFYLFCKAARLKKLSFLFCFSFLYLTMLIIRSGFTESLETSVRFIFPLLPAFLIACFHVFQWVRSKIRGPNLANALILFLVLANGINLYINRDFNDDVIQKRANQEMVSWVKQNISPQEHYMFWKPRFLALLTGRVGAALTPGLLEHLTFDERVQGLGISYVILSQENDTKLRALLKNHRLWACVWENREYKVFKKISD